jgi:hypothetical protein
MEVKKARFAGPFSLEQHGNSEDFQWLAMDAGRPEPRGAEGMGEKMGLGPIFCAHRYLGAGAIVAGGDRC